MEETTTETEQLPPQANCEQTDEATGLQMRMGGLDTSAYLSTSASSSALVVLASQPSSQVQGLEKEPASPFYTPFTSAGSFPALPMFGPADTYPPHLLPVSSPMMNSSGLDRQVSFLNSGTGSNLRPLEVTDERVGNGFNGSAFIPANVLKTDNSDPTSSQSFQHPKYQSNNIFQSDASTSQSFRVSPPVRVKKECSTDKGLSMTSPEVPDHLAETAVSDGGDSTDRGTPEEGRLRRKVKKRGLLDGQASCCPVCGVTIRPAELLSHFEQEVEKLNKINKILRRPTKEGTPQIRNSPSPGSSRKKDSINALDSRWNTFQKVQCNRQHRLGVRSCKTKKKLAEETLCPVCCERLTGNQEELNLHVERCLRKIENNGSEDETVDVEAEEAYEEYEWAGQMRVRATSFLKGGFAASGFQTRRHNSEDDEQDLNVDSDDTATYGQPQYTEADVIPCSSDEPTENREREELRRAMLIDAEGQQRIPEGSKWVCKNEHQLELEGNEQPALTNGEIESEKATITQDKLQTVTSLKSRIKELEKQNHHNDKMKCLICMEPYTQPVVSVCCWHVHCEECWLRTLGAKKLCPQCNMITSPNDLRRIYL
ncbi:E3 ubiquitin-protein ligase RNF220-like isoform X2 [Limulus polyphemus]|uniref:E3 ubiquitin-protein ligase RNF220-like isoform X2 n=1 Tax=Limulus polyphemus TaxID=6850 RepID=A0ABM1TF68_LIMPO|nr:E3 ubiquitin-protein ligase RNF220-like isoform X2 [Limulus polyphemus]